MIDLCDDRDDGSVTTEGTLRLEYRLEGAGWATAEIAIGDQRVEMAASYLHDSLRDLASGARALAEGAREVTVVFMDEPGEHHVTLRCRGDEILVEVTWHSDWASLGFGTCNGEVRLRGQTRVAHVRGQVLAVLRDLLDRHGAVGYRQLWGEHDFPLAEYEALRAAP